MQAGKQKDEDSTGSWMDQLVDICLSLSAYYSAALPSSAIRDAVEAVFRAFAAQLTPTGTAYKLLANHPLLLLYWLLVVCEVPSQGFSGANACKVDSLYKHASGTRILCRAQIECHFKLMTVFIIELICTENSAMRPKRLVRVL